MDPAFDKQKRDNVQALKTAEDLKALSRRWFECASRHSYSYNFSWLGLPIIQFPQDIVAMQEIVWSCEPDLIVETGIARGGSLIFYASILELLGGDRRVLGIDVEIRPHNRVEIERHRLSKRIDMIEGSSISEEVAARVYEAAKGRQRVFVVLDSNHTDDHVYRELMLYSRLVQKGSYLVVFDTVIDDLPRGFYTDRPWDKGNNPKTAVKRFLETTDRFEVDVDIEAKLQITVAPSGFLRCVKD